MGKLHRSVGDELTLYVRQLAWLQATPKPPKGSRAAGVADQSPRKSRADVFKARKIEPPMPPNPLPHVLRWFTEMGISEAAGMGSAPLSWVTIDAWQRITGTRLSPWEARLIRSLSVAYLAESREAEDENRPAPWSAVSSAPERNAELAQLVSVLG